ncbi:hypothetical protein HZS_887 [Henneguya salminicola]|nr:hypothetical protein HZS_887 [Henneguya salminicola]
MATIGNRFNSLLINAQDPLERASKKGKKNKKYAVASSKPIEFKKTEPKPPPAIIQSEVPQSKKLDVQNIPIVEKLKPRIKVSSVKITPTPVEVVENNEPKIIIEKDDRGSHARSTYKKMTDIRGKRLLDRHGGPKTSVKPLEKRHGQGAYNWGDAVKSEDGTTEYDKSRPESDKPGESAEPPKENSQPQFTLQQYKELLKENKVDPLAWEASMIPAEMTQESTEDLKDYAYWRMYEEGGRGRGTGRYNRGRGGRGRGYREPRGDRGNFRGQDRRENRQRISEVHVDDVKDFPAL